MTIRQAAERLGVSSARVHQLVQQGRIAGRKVGGRVVVEGDSVLAHRRLPGGRKPITSAIVDQAAHLRRGGATLEEISRALGVSKSAVVNRTRRAPLPVIVDRPIATGDLDGARRWDCSRQAECTTIATKESGLRAAGWTCAPSCRAFVEMSEDERRADLDGLAGLAQAIMNESPQAIRATRLAEERGARRAREEEEAADEGYIPKVLPRWMRRAG